MLSARNSTVWSGTTGRRDWRPGARGGPAIRWWTRDAPVGSRRLHAQSPAHGGRILSGADLGIDWRHGERHFAACLNDFDLAANNGGWQWAASTGATQPYFRIFNPVSQSERFDPDGRFIRRYLPELARVPIAIHAPYRHESGRAGGGRVVPAATTRRPGRHAAARRRTLERYRSVDPTLSLGGLPIRRRARLVVGFSEVVIGAVPPHCLAVFVGGTGGDHDDRDSLPLVVGPECCGPVRSHPCAAFRYPTGMTSGSTSRSCSRASRRRLWP